MKDPWKDALRGVIFVDPEVMHGTPCFTGTRVPVQALLDHLQGDSTLEAFLEGFPSVSRYQAVQFLELAKDRLGSSAYPDRRVRTRRRQEGFSRPSGFYGWVSDLLPISGCCRSPKDASTSS